MAAVSYGIGHAPFSRTRNMKEIISRETKLIEIWSRFIRRTQFSLTISKCSQGLRMRLMDTAFNRRRFFFLTLKVEPRS